MLELGSGTGLVGLIAAVLGANVWITDQACVYHSIVKSHDVNDENALRPLLEIMSRNVELNKLSDRVQVLELNWFIFCLLFLWRRRY